MSWRTVAVCGILCFTASIFRMTACAEKQDHVYKCIGPLGGSKQGIPGCP